MAKKSQIQKFRETAMELEVELTPERFDAALKRVAQHKPEAKPPVAKAPRKKRQP